MGLVLTWPVGRADHRQSDSRPAAGPVLAYVLASAAGAGAVALAIALVARSIAETSVVADDFVRAFAVAIGLLAVILQARGRVRPLPERRAQVPRGWLTWTSRTRTAVAFGVMIGSSVLTHMRHASVYVIGALVVLAPSWELGVAVGILYGFCRGLPVFVTWIADRTGRSRPAWPEQTDRSRPINIVLAVTSLASLLIALAMVHQ